MHMSSGVTYKGNWMAQLRGTKLWEESKSILCGYIFRVNVPYLKAHLATFQQNVATVFKCCECNHPTRSAFRWYWRPGRKYRDIFVAKIMSLHRRNVEFVVDRDKKKWNCCYTEAFSRPCRYSMKTTKTTLKKEKLARALHGGVTAVTAPHIKLKQKSKICRAEG